MDLPPEMVAIPAAFAPLFSPGVWTKARALAVGAILATGPRTVCAALRILGLGPERPFTTYHRVLNRDARSRLAAGQVLLGLIVALIPRDWLSPWPPTIQSNAATAAGLRPRAATAIPCGRRSGTRSGASACGESP